MQADDDYTGVATAESELPTVQVTKEPEPEDSCMKTHVSFLNVRSLPISMSPDDFTEDSRRDTGFSGWGFRKEDSFTTQPKLSTVGLSGRPIVCSFLSSFVVSTIESSEEITTQTVCHRSEDKGSG